MFYAAQAWEASRQEGVTRIENGEQISCCYGLTTFCALMGVGAAGSAIGYTLLAEANMAGQFSYQAAMRAGAVGAQFVIHQNTILHNCGCAAPQIANDNQASCVTSLQNITYYTCLDDCFVPGSIAHAVTSTIRSGGLGVLSFMCGTAILNTPILASQAVVLAGSGNLILGSVVAVNNVVYHSLNNGNIDCCTPTDSFAASIQCTKVAPSCLTSWQSFSKAPKVQDMDREEEQIRSNDSTLNNPLLPAPSIIPA